MRLEKTQKSMKRSVQVRPRSQRLKSEIEDEVEIEVECGRVEDEVDTEFEVKLRVHICRYD